MDDQVAPHARTLGDCFRTLQGDGPDRLVFGQGKRLGETTALQVAA